MIYRFRAEEVHKQRLVSSEIRFKKDGHEADEVTDPDIDPAEFFDPEEFGYRRKLEEPRL